MYVCTAHAWDTYLKEEKTPSMFNVNIKHVNRFLEDDTAAVGLFQRGRKTVPGSGKCVVVFSARLLNVIFIFRRKS
jgi:hypothetical protein